MCVCVCVCIRCLCMCVCLCVSDVALEREVEGDMMLGDMGAGVPFRPGMFDGAISISAVQWLCYADSAAHRPAKRLYKLFMTLFASLVIYFCFMCVCIICMCVCVWVGFFLKINRDQCWSLLCLPEVLVTWMVNVTFFSAVCIAMNTMPCTTHLSDRSQLTYPHFKKHMNRDM